jgi:hypothetical protein
MSTTRETPLYDLVGLQHSFLKTLVYTKVVWCGTHANLGHDELGHSSTLKNMENEEFPEKVP